MDIETLSLITDSLKNWAQDNTDFFQQIEQDSTLLTTLYNQLNKLGVLNLLGEEDTHHELHALAAMAYEIARFSPSVALMLVQQNLAAWLFYEAKQELPENWVALPLYDAVVEWPYSQWQGIPLLPVANLVLVPFYQHKKDDFKLYAITNKTQQPTIQMLGLRAVPHADLAAKKTDFSDANILLEGADGLEKFRALWSQAEICMLAIRSAIADSSYQTAEDYAKERYQGGKIIIQHSLIQKMLADFYREKAAMYELWQSIGQSLKPYQPLNAGQLSLMLNSGEKLPWLSSDGIQILGGVGYMEDYPQERRYRDAKQCEFLLGHPQAKNLSQWKMAN